MAKEFEIRLASAHDIPLILQLIKELADYEKLLHEVVASETLLRENLFGEHAHAEVIIAYYDNKPVGFALFFHNFSTFLGKSGLYIEDLFVNPEMRGRGFGKKMLIYLTQLAKERNCGRVEWWVLDWNKPAIKFYEKIGAKPMDEWTVFRMDNEAIENLAK